MTDRKLFDALVGPQESHRLFGALQRGVTRRDILKMLMAGGMQAALAGSLATTAMSAHAQTPRKGGRIRVAGFASSVNDTLDPAKQSNRTDYARGFMFYNGLTRLDGNLAPQPALAEAFTTDRTPRYGRSSCARASTSTTARRSRRPTSCISINRHKDPATGSKAKALADQIDGVDGDRPATR